MPNFTSIKIGNSLIRKEGNFAKRQDGSIAVELFCFTLQKELIRFKKNFVNIEEVTFYNDRFIKPSIYKGPYSINVIYDGLAMLERIFEGEAEEGNGPVS